MTVTRNGGTLSEVPSGSNNNEIRFVYEATVELSSPRNSDGDFLNTDSYSSSHAGIQLTIPDGWSTPQPLPDPAPTANAENTASVTVSGPRSIFFDYGDDGDINGDLQIVGNNRITVPIKRITRGQRITLTYGAGVDKAEAQGTKGEPSFTIQAKGGESGDSFANLPEAGPVGEAGDIKFEVVAAGDGSGTIMATVEGGVTGPDVYGGNSDIEITFIYTAVGTLEPSDTGAEIRIVPPTGWTVPQGSPGLPGFTAQAAADQNKLGAPTFDGVGVTFPMPNVTSGTVINIVYGSGQGDSGAKSPNQRSDPDDLEKAPKFIVTMRGSSGGTFEPVIRSGGVEAEYAFSGIPIKITNAESGTGSHG